jgi:uncharacterized DUF497 family protein
MGIENTALESIIRSNQCVTRMAERCVRFLCEKRCHTSQRQPMRLVEIPARTIDEPRWLLIGKIAQKHWSAVITRREDKIRLISVRRSRDEEIAIYESQDL